MPNRMEEMASKGMGALKDVKATVKGLHGVFKKLSEEHGEVTALLMRVKASSDADVRRELFPKIRAELLGHEKGELRDVYPEFESRPELAQIAKDHGTEASQLEHKLDELNRLSFEAPEWKDKFDELVELVSHHVDEEEGEFFPKGEEILGESKAEEMQSRYERTKSSVTEEALRQPS